MLSGCHCWTHLDVVEDSEHDAGDVLLVGVCATIVCANVSARQCVIHSTDVNQLSLYQIANATEHVHGAGITRAALQPQQARARGFSKVPPMRKSVR